MACPEFFRPSDMNATLLSLRRLSFAAALALSLTPALARAPIPPRHPALAIANAGSFKSSDGISGTYKETEILFDLNRSSSRTIVFTRRSDEATRTEKTDYLTNPDGTHTENVSITDYGATAAFTSSRVITTLGRRQSTGQGTYTTADGVSGTLTTLETASSLGVDALTTVYNSPTGGISVEQRTQTVPAGKVIVKTIGVNPGGAATSVIQTRTPSNFLDGFHPTGL